MEDRNTPSTSDCTSKSISTTEAGVTSRSNEATSNPSSNFANAFSALKETSNYQEAQQLVPPLQQKQPSGAASGKPPSKYSVVVSSRQRGNPLLKHIRSVPYEFGEVVPDYVMGVTNCAIFLSLRYHRLNPRYIHDRLKDLGKQYKLRVLLVQVDVSDPHKELQQLSRVCVLADLTLMLAWSAEEAARIIEVYKMFEHKPPDLIMERQATDPMVMVLEALGSISRITRTDALSLMENFGSFEGVVNASIVQLTLVPGIGPQKAAKLHTILHQPFCKHASAAV